MTSRRQSRHSGMFSLTGQGRAGATLYDPYVQSAVQMRRGAQELSSFVFPPFVAAIFVPLS